MNMNFAHEFKRTSIDNVKQMYTDKLEVACESIIKLNYTDENTDKRSHAWN